MLGSKACEIEAVKFLSESYLLVKASHLSIPEVILLVGIVLLNLYYW